MVHQIKYIASNLGIPLTRVLMNVLHYWVMGIPSAVPSMPIERGRMGFRGVSGSGAVHKVRHASNLFIVDIYKYIYIIVYVYTHIFTCLHGFVIFLRSCVFI